MSKKFTIVRLLCAFAIAMALSVGIILVVIKDAETLFFTFCLCRLPSNVHFFGLFSGSVPLIFTVLSL